MEYQSPPEGSCSNETAVAREGRGGKGVQGGGRLLSPELPGFAADLQFAEGARTSSTLSRAFSVLIDGVKVATHVKLKAVVGLLTGPSALQTYALSCVYRWQAE